LAIPNLMTILTIGVSVLVSGSYYIRPPLASIAPGIGVSPDIAGCIASVRRIGYGNGLFAPGPIADLAENLKLVLTLLYPVILDLPGVVISITIGVFFVASVLTGVCAARTRCRCRSSRIWRQRSGVA
jgi:hypothetical protein